MEINHFKLFYFIVSYIYIYYILYNTKLNQLYKNACRLVQNVHLSYVVHSRKHYSWSGVDESMLHLNRFNRTVHVTRPMLAFCCL